MASSSEPVSSPCVRNCCLNDNDICLGCGRSMQEIMNWQSLPDAEKDRVRRKAAEWLKKQNR